MKNKGVLRFMAVTGAFVLAITACGDTDEQAPEPVESPADTAPGESPGTEDGGDAAEGTEGESNGYVTLSGEQEHRVTDAAAVDIACDGGGEIDVEAAAEVTLTGDCRDIEIHADGATVIADQARDLEIEGSQNQVTVETLRELQVEGSDNTVDLGAVDEIEVEGSDNTVTYGEGDPRVEDEGSGNSIEQG